MPKKEQEPPHPHPQNFPIIDMWLLWPPTSDRILIWNRVWAPSEHHTSAATSA